MAGYESKKGGHQHEKPIKQTELFTFPGTHE
jgi:hypothetical protein